jgi:hypothetical protein
MDQLCPRVEDGEGVAASPTLGDVLRAFLASAAQFLNLVGRPLRVLRLLAACGLPELGANLYRCCACHKRHFAPRSCGDRHCPRCLASKSRRWLAQQLGSLLPITYYHCVFTLPSELHTLVLLNPTRLYPLLFECATAALLEFGANRLGGDLGITALLHTWGQQLNFHPHLHCIVTGGALRRDGRGWRSPKQRKFLFPIRAVAALFRGKLLHGLQQLLQDPDALRLPEAFPIAGSARRRWFTQLYAQRWVVYAKRPFGGPEQVLAYLANYTHRVAISNRRIVALDPQAQTVTFTYRDYRHASQVKTATLNSVEFIRRFACHILPRGLVRIRHYGILGNNRRHRDIPRARAILERRGSRRPTPLQPPALPPSKAIRRCPHCGHDQLRWLGFTDARGRTHVNAASLLYDSS